MPSKLKPFFYLAAVIFIIFILSQPYNFFCQFTNKCSPVYLLDLLPSKKGSKKINVVFEVRNYSGKVNLEILNPTVSTVGGKNIIANYKAKNLFNGITKFRTEFYVEPEEFTNYIIRRNCLCSSSHKLNRNEEMELSSNFKILPEIDKDRYFKNNLENLTIKIGYIVK